MIMITYEHREQLEKTRMYKDSLFAGWDCEGNKLEIGDKVEVVREEENERYKDSEYAFCSKGKQGKITRYFSGWIVTVEFPEGKIVGCADFNLKKI